MTPADRYQRHSLIDWFSQAEVAGARMAVVGAGAVGNEVLKCLALLGVGALDIFDCDRVELHNLTRSVLFRESDVGRSKAECADSATVTSRNCMRAKPSCAASARDFSTNSRRLSMP